MDGTDYVTSSFVNGTHINHSFQHNIKPKVVFDYDNNPKICFFAERIIVSGEQLLYVYDNSPNKNAPFWIQKNVNASY